MKLLFPSFLSLCLALSISFLSCKSAPDITGEYKISMEGMEGMDELPPEQAEKMKEMVNEFKIVLKEDNKFTLTMMGEGAEGTYKQKGSNNLELTMEGGTEVATIEGNKITMEAQGNKMVFIKE